MKISNWIIGAALLTCSVNAQAQTITFGSGPITPYSGTTFEAGFAYSESAGSLLLGDRGNLGRDMEGTASDGGGVLSVASATSGGVFTFGSTDYAAIDFRGPSLLTLTVSGYLGGALQGSDTFSLASVAPIFGTPYPNWTTFNALNLAGVSVDRLDFGMSAGNANGALYWNAVDNIRLGTAAVPEPATWAMMIAGFGLVGGALRRRRFVPRPA